MNVCLAYMYLLTIHVPGPVEVRRGYNIFWKRYRLLCATMLVLLCGTEPRTSARAASALHFWAISLPHLLPFFWSTRPWSWSPMHMRQVLYHWVTAPNLLCFKGKNFLCMCGCRHEHDIACMQSSEDNTGHWFLTFHLLVLGSLFNGCMCQVSWP